MERRVTLAALLTASTVAAAASRIAAAPHPPPSTYAERVDCEAAKAAMVYGGALLRRGGQPTPRWGEGALADGLRRAYWNCAVS
eukprot:gene4509-12063_t